MQVLVRYTVAFPDGDKGRTPRWAQAAARSWLPPSPLPQLGPPLQPGPPRLMAAGQPPFQVCAQVKFAMRQQTAPVSLAMAQLPFEISCCRSDPNRHGLGGLERLLAGSFNRLPSCCVESLLPHGSKHPQRRNYFPSCRCSC